MSKRIFLFAAALLLAVALGIGSQQFLGRGSRSSAAEPIAVGIIAPLTGNYSEWGQYFREGVQLAERQIGGSGSQPSLKLYIEDSRSSVRDALSALNKITDQAKLIAVMTMDSEAVKALAPVTTERKTLLLATIAGGANLFQPEQLGLRWYQNAQSISSALSQLATRRGYKRVFIIHENHVFANSVAVALTADLQKNGASVIGRETFNPDAESARDQAAKAIQSSPDVIVVSGTGGRPYVSAIRSLRELGWKGPILCDDSMNLPNVQRDTGDAAKDIVFVASAFNPAEPATERQRQFVDKYRSQYGRAPTDTAAYTYELLLMVRDLTAGGAVTSEALNKAFQALKDRETVFGPVSYLGNHELSVPMVLRTLSDRGGQLKAVPVQP